MTRSVSLAPRNRTPTNRHVGAYIHVISRAFHRTTPRPCPLFSGFILSCVYLCTCTCSVTELTVRGAQEGTLLARAIEKPKAWHHFVIEEAESGGDSETVSVSLFTAHRTHVAVEGQGAQRVLQHTCRIAGDDKRAMFQLVHAN